MRGRAAGGRRYGMHKSDGCIPELRWEWAGIMWDWRAVVWGSSFDWALVTNVGTLSARDVVGEGALRGRSPRTREGRIGPTAQMRGESEEERGESNAAWSARNRNGNRPRFGCYRKKTKAFLQFERRLKIEVFGTGSACMVHSLSIICPQEGLRSRPFVFDALFVN